jgi:hypothetical protein
VSILIAILGTWILSDAIYSILLYLSQPGIDGKKQQTWLRDHSIRVIRGLIGIALIIIAYKIGGLL